MSNTVCTRIYSWIAWIGLPAPVHSGLLERDGLAREPVLDEVVGREHGWSADCHLSPLWMKPAGGGV